MHFKKKLIKSLSCQIKQIKFKKKVLDSLRIFGLLLYKCWLVRKRQWVSSLIVEILIPVSLIFFVWLMFEEKYSSKLEPYDEEHYERRSFEEMIDEISEFWPMKILYTPSNPFTNQLMMEVQKCLKYKTSINGFDTESKLLANVSDEPYNLSTMPVILDEHTNESTNHLCYEILSDATTIRGLYGPSITGKYSLETQICLDHSYIKIKSNRNFYEIPQIFAQRMPYPSLGQTRGFDRGVSILGIIVALMIPLFVESSNAMKEKLVGMNVLMSMYGISNTLNLLSWMMSGLMLLSILSVTLVVFFTFIPMDDPFFCFGNPLILFTFFILHFSHSIAFVLHLSAHVSKPFPLMCMIIIIRFLVTVMQFFVFKMSFHHPTPYIGTIFPIASLYQAIYEIHAYEIMAIGIQWNNLFRSSDPSIKTGGSLGMIMVLSVIGTLLHFLFAVYMYLIKPGKYGIGRHPLFFMMLKKHRKETYKVENLIFDDKNHKYFEPTSSKSCVPGIQIRNLTKTYNIGIRKKEKIHALRGLSIDFYKGQITSILGHNGAGKSTLMSILTGVTSPTDGLILMNSKNLKEEACEILKDVGFYAQQDMYFPNLTVAEQLQFFAMVKKEGASRLLVQQKVMNLLQKLKLLSIKDSLPEKLSENQKRKLCLGMAFIGDPDILILDEPTSDLDYENKRVIWDILLEMKGRKTILISTHDMEEADILADKIAIMHEGQIKSYGTPLYLKKMIAGQKTIDITLSIERWCDVDRICNQIHSKTKVIERLDKKVRVNVPLSTSLVESLNNLREKEKDLGVIDFKLSHVGLEQVFLKVAEEYDIPAKLHEDLPNDEKKSTGTVLYRQSIRALFTKKLTYFLKNPRTLIMQIAAGFLAVLGITIVLNSINYDVEPKKPIPVQLDMYENPYVLYTSTDEMLGDHYKSISKSFGATSVIISDTYLDNGLLQLAKKDLMLYRNQLIAAAEFNKSADGSLTVNAFISDTISLSRSISMNLISNTIMRSHLGLDYSISISGQLILRSLDSSDYMFLLIVAHVTAMILATLIYLVAAMFSVNPNRESIRGLKHLQQMTGVSGFAYWATMFLSDLAHYAILMIFLTR